MNEGPKQAWLKALRSGEFAQGKRVLIAKDDEGLTRYCCLGVACILAMNAGVEGLELQFSYADEEIDVDDDVEELGIRGNTMIGVFVSQAEFPYADGTIRTLDNRDAELLPAPVREWLGVGSNNPDTEALDPSSNRRMSLAQLNDAGRTFAEIADIIERDL
jgi:hypothetical protein